MKHEGDLIVKAGVDYRHITEVGGYVYLKGATVPDNFLAKCTSIGGYVDLEGATVPDNFLAKCTSIGGSVYLEGATVPDNFLAHCKTEDRNCPAKEITKRALFSSFLKKGYIFADNILAKLLSKKTCNSTSVFKVVIAGKIEASYVIEKNGIYSHGATVQEAKASLIFKISDRDTSKFESWDLDTEITAEEAIASYRVITGACEFGVKHFCEDKDLSKKYTPREIVELTRGSYGHETYSAFFNKELSEAA